MEEGKDSPDDNEQSKDVIVLEEKIKTANYKEKIRYYDKYTEEIGRGGFSRCYKCMEQETQQYYAVKEIYKFNLRKNRSLERLFQEINIQKSLSHDNIVKFITCFEDNINVYIILELCENGNLYSLIKRRKKLKEIEVQYYLYQLVEVLKYLHGKKKIVHRDLSLKNILISKKMELKLADFGLATKFQDLDSAQMGTPQFMAPEVLMSKMASHKVDIWALGIIIYNLILGKPPFETKLDILNYNDNLIFPKDALISDAAKDLIRQILVKDPEKRPSLDLIRSHDFFHLGECIPKLIPVKFLKDEPSLPYIRNFMSEADENGIVNKTVQKTNLIDYEVNIMDDTNYIKDINIYVTRYIDSYKDMYGIGYKLNNNNYGAYFRDCTKMIFNPKLREIFYLKRDENRNLQKYIYKVDDLDNEDTKFFHDRNKKWDILNNFIKKLDENSNSSTVSTIKPEISEEDIENEGGIIDKDYIHVKRYYKYQNIVLFRLSNHKLQVNFKHNETIIISTIYKTITHMMKHNGRYKQYVYPLDSVMEIPDKDLHNKLILIQNAMRRIQKENEKHRNKKLE